VCVSDQPGCPCCYEIPVIKSKFSSVETGRKKVKKRIQTYHTELVDEESIRRWRHPHTTVHVYVKTLPTGAEAGFTVQVLSCKESDAYMAFVAPLCRHQRVWLAVLWSNGCGRVQL